MRGRLWSGGLPEQLQNTGLWNRTLLQNDVFNLRHIGKQHVERGRDIAAGIAAEIGGGLERRLAAVLYVLIHVHVSLAGMVR